MPRVELGPIDHLTLRVRPDELTALRAFYVDVLGLRDGARPDFDFPGHWLYAGERAIVHLAGVADGGEGRAGETGALDHVALAARGLADTRERLAAHGVPWREAPVQGLPLHQVFLRDPAGLKLELTFDAAESAT